jgi:hypothetical protein
MAYRTLEERFKRLSDVGGALAVLEWDHQVMMPRGGNETRAEQVARQRDRIRHPQIAPDQRLERLSIALPGPTDQTGIRLPACIKRTHQPAISLSVLMPPAAATGRPAPAPA